jgi:hypothetical protein
MKRMFVENITGEKLANVMAANFSNKLVERMKIGGDLCNIANFAKRWPEFAIRIAGILHLWNWKTYADREILREKLWKAPLQLSKISLFQSNRRFYNLPGKRDRKSSPNDWKVL